MGRITYSPKENKAKNVKGVEKGVKEQALSNVESLTRTRFNNVTQIGEPDSEYRIYVEDYVYTYLYQYAAKDLACEHSAIFLGKFYEETKEAVIVGVIPVSKDKLTYENEWISKDVLESIEEEKEEYFAGTDCIGWMHMQPGYGTMLTMKELKAHDEVFGNNARLLLLMDPINKIETFFVYEEELFKEQIGYAMYYERNEAMQRYMLEHPFILEEKEVVEDEVVNQFREIGKIRKKEYYDRKKANFTIVAASLLVLALTAVVVKINGQGGGIKSLPNNEQVISTKAPKIMEEELKVIIETPDQAKDAMEVVEATSKDLTVIDATEAKEEARAEVKEEVKEEVKAEVKEEVKEEAKAEVKEEVKEEVEMEAKEDTPYKTYVVQEGDTLRKISYDHFKTEEKTKDIIKINDLKDGDKIFVGEKIKLPLE